jgi:hypothetical protein
MVFFKTSDKLATIVLGGGGGGGINLDQKWCQTNFEINISKSQPMGTPTSTKGGGLQLFNRANNR